MNSTCGICGLYLGCVPGILLSPMSFQEYWKGLNNAKDYLI